MRDPAATWVELRGPLGTVRLPLSPATVRLAVRDALSEQTPNPQVPRFSRLALQPREVAALFARR